MSLRTGHGAGAGSPRIEVLPADELPRPDPIQTAINLDERRRLRGKPFAKGNRTGGRVCQLTLLGVPLAASDPVYRRLLEQAASYRRKRVSELAALHGYVSAGTAGLLASSALATSASRWAYAKAAESGDLTLLKLASGLANDARQHELAALELAAREGAASKAKEDPRSASQSLEAALADGRDDVRPPFATPPGGSMPGAPFPAPPTSTESAEP